MKSQLAKENQKTKTIVSFYLDDKEYGIDIRFIQEIIQLVEITGIPESPPFVEGIINLRGHVVPIINLRTVLNIELQELDLSTPIIVVSHQNLTLGFIIDMVEDVINIPVNDIESPSSFYPIAKYLDGVCKLPDRLLLLFDIHKLFTIEDQGFLEQLSLIDKNE